ncbi:MAG TPA: helix-turn-helix domain-containing protein [Verrucomicrobiae bacterium]
MKTQLAFRSLPKTYQGLVEMHMLRPVRDKVEFENALEMLEPMAGHKLNREQEDYFDALSTLVEAYEREHVPPSEVKGIELLRHLLEANDMSAADLARLLGCDRSLGVRIMNGERQLTIPHIKKLAERFGLPVEVFID